LDLLAFDNALAGVPIHGEEFAIDGKGSAELGGTDALL
jgi:hypothetical protein